MAIYKFDETAKTATLLTDPAKPLGLFEEVRLSLMDPLSGETITTGGHSLVSILGFGGIMLLLGAKFVYSLPKIMQPKDLGAKTVVAG